MTTGGYGSATLKSSRELNGVAIILSYTTWIATVEPPKTCVAAVPERYWQI